MIRLTAARAALDDVAVLIAEVDGVQLQDWPDQEGDRHARKEKAQLTRKLLLIADRLDLAAQLVRAEYWFAKGEPDILQPERDD